ncbi:MAG: pyridoxamine 5'-phosphate oxidase family protein [Actinomycetota bacterium]|nr:pyridoxamine 5'-phosphate oxidase family protein [Actinomycetota bacterium]
MRSMPMSEIEERLSDSLQAILSVSRKERGPLAVPMSFLFAAGEFRMITSPDSQHGKLIRKTGRATMTIEAEDYGPRSVEQWYVMAEGPIRFTDDDPVPLLRAVMEKDRGAEFLEEWVAQSLPNVLQVAILTPETLSGYFGRSELD